MNEKVVKISKKAISFVYMIFFIIFVICAEVLDAAGLALVLNLVLLIGLFLYYGIIGIIKSKLIPKSNIILWFCFVIANVPLIFILERAGIIDSSPGAFGLGTGGMEYLFLIPINLIFAIVVVVENILLYLWLKIKKIRAKSA